ncbi:unnamed protein product [Adineta ricciae]|uniref:Uncharacterized protein n=1 Tax=Adineta ricciae TaxID=249248 RepID=A0A814R5S9_ADIRI|nr:unnamed protein product [Adineta ricciae]
MEPLVPSNRQLSEVPTSNATDLLVGTFLINQENDGSNTSVGRETKLCSDLSFVIPLPFITYSDACNDIFVVLNMINCIILIMLNHVLRHQQ